MGSGHSHGTHEDHSTNTRRLAIVLALILVYMVAEIIGGLMTNSLALLADAGHMLSDAGAMALALFAIWIARRPAPASHTYGYYRTEILAALANGATLIAVAIYIFIEAYQRLGAPPEVQGATMMAIALGGLVTNGICLWLLNDGRSESLNVRGAWLHVLTDALGSIGAIVAAMLIWAFNWNWIDPLVSVLIGLLVVYSAWSLLKETVAVLMEQAPGDIDVDTVRGAMCQIDDVDSVHDLHIWTITSGIVALSAHVGVAGRRPSDAVLTDICNILHERFGIEHTTIQLESLAYTEREIPV